MAYQVVVKCIRDLDLLRLKDFSTFNQYAQRSSCPANSWWGQFPYFWGYSLKGKRQSLWTIVKGLFVPFIFSSKYLSLLCPPFGKASPEVYFEVIQQSLCVCARQNGSDQKYTYIKWVTQDQLDFLLQSKRFQSLFQAKELSIGPEYHYSIQALLELKGREFSYVRRKISRLERDFPRIIIRPYRFSDHTQIMKLYDLWLKEAGSRLGSIFDKDYFEPFIKQQGYLRHIVLVAVLDDDIIGMISGACIANGQSYCFVRKSLRKYSGLAEKLVLELVYAIHATDSRVTLLNDGGGGLKPGLMHFKTHFRPRIIMNRYRVAMKPLHILQKNAYRGVSIASYFPAARLVIDGDQVDLFEQLADDRIKRCNSILLRAFGEDLQKQKLVSEKSPARILAQTAILLQQAARHPVNKYRIQSIAINKAEICFEMLRPALLQPLCKLLQSFWQAGIRGGEAAIFVKQYEASRDSITFRLREFIIWDRIRTAHRLGIEAWPGKGSTIWLGWGAASCLTSMGYSQKTSRLGKRIAGDKGESFRLMQEHGLPLPEQKIVGRKREALQAAEHLGYPVVLKPVRGNKGLGVTANITSVSELSRAYALARETGRKVIVESYVDGDDFRLLVVNGRFVAAVKRVPPQVVGDGLHTVAALIEILNQRERRDGLYLYPLAIDDEVIRLLKKQNMQTDSIPAKGQIVILRNVANVSLGGATQDVTDQVHPDNRAAAVTAAKACLLDFAGIDFKTPDISQSWCAGKGKIIEINSGPGADLHLQPTAGTRRDVSYHIVRSHFSAQRKGKNPIILVSGRYGKMETAHFCARIWSVIGLSAGILLNSQLIKGDKKIRLGGTSFEQEAVLHRQGDIDASVVVRSFSSLLAEGLASDRYTCTILTDDKVDANLAQKYHDKNIAAKVFQVSANMATHGIVIDGSIDTLVQAVAHIPSRNIVRVWTKPYATLPVSLQSHLDAGGRVLGISRAGDSPEYVLNWYEGKSCTPLVHVSKKDIPETKSMMMAVGAMLLSTLSVKDLHPVLDSVWSNRMQDDTGNSLVVDQNSEETCFACADPADVEALHDFLKFGQKARRIWLVAMNASALSLEWQEWAALFPLEKICWMLTEEKDCSSENKGNQSKRCVEVFGSIDSAWQEAMESAGTSEVVLLLESDAYLRKELFNTRSKRKYCPQPLHNSASSAQLWSAEKLAEIFQGTWINGPAHGWGVGHVGIAGQASRPDGVTVLQGFPNQPDTVLNLEKKLKKAVGSETRAVISPLISGALPRWRPVLQADDPQKGIIRLGRYARRRLSALVVGLDFSEVLAQSIVSRVRVSLPDHLAKTLYLGEWPGRESDALVSTALSLANTPQNKGLCFFRWGNESKAADRLLSPNVVIVDGQKLQSPENVDGVPDMLEMGMKLYIMAPKEDHRHWYGCKALSGIVVQCFSISANGSKHDNNWKMLTHALMDSSSVMNQMQV